ncbi:MAG TPA: cysteine desulfurase family protein [Phototrophicaceae bacterium]|nr:cysteine desulfurase family protein [Phototrophicaceae bacterium]
MAPTRSVYLDHSATTPTDSRVVAAMLPYFTEIYGNASSTHQFGRSAEAAIETARETVARVLNCQPSEIVFTSCGSESDNLALRGAAWTTRQQERGQHLVTTPIEHLAVIRTVQQLAELMGFESTLVPVDRTGLVDVGNFASACRPGTTVVSVVYANNEVGTIQPLAQLAALAHARGAWFHTDAVQAAGQLSLDVSALGVDLLSLSGHKFYGPKGVGALYVRSGIELIPSQSGGSHESGRRAGTHNTPLIVGLAKALELAAAEQEAHITHFRLLRDGLIDGILNGVPGAQLTGHRERRLPSHASFVFEGVDANRLLMHLDLKGIAASSASACKTGNPEPSGVLLALGYSREEASSSLRLTVGRQTTVEDVDYAVKMVMEAVEKVRKLSRGFVVA